MLPSVVAAMVAAAIVHGPCPGENDQPLGCAVASNNTIYLTAKMAPVLQRAVLLHERGHLFDSRALDFYEREHIEEMFGWTEWRPERFADRFASCWTPKRQRIALRRGGTLWLPRPRVCGLIVIAADVADPAQPCKRTAVDEFQTLLDQQVAATACAAEIH